MKVSVRVRKCESKASKYFSAVYGLWVYGDFELIDAEGKRYPEQVRIEAVPVIYNHEIFIEKGLKILKDKKLIKHKVIEAIMDLYNNKVKALRSKDAASEFQALLDNSTFTFDMQDLKVE